MEKQLVSFTLLAYNQESFIREAIESSFAQTYQPLEIILSDDYSNDRTYDIMRDLASAYAGPHKVTVRRNASNLGTLDHILEISHSAAGRIIVVAAGDDISMPHRTSHIVNAMHTSAAWVFSSNSVNFSGEDFFYFPYDNMVLDKNHPANILRDGSLINIHGATAAYKTSFLRDLSKSNRRILIEDIPLCTLCQIIGGVAVFDPTELIFYRFHRHNLSNRAIDEDPWLAEVKSFSNRSNLINSYKWLSNELDRMSTFSHSPCTLNLNSRKLRDYVSILTFLSKWPELSIIGKLRYLVSFLRTKRLGSFFIRILGPKAFRSIQAVKSVRFRS